MANTYILNRTYPGIILSQMKFVNEQIYLGADILLATDEIDRV